MFRWQDWWGGRVTAAEAARRAGGRRRYNAVRRLVAERRRVRVSALALEGRTQAEIARTLGVHRCTISRDLARLQARWLEATTGVPYCRKVRSRPRPCTVSECPKPCRG